MIIPASTISRSLLMTLFISILFIIINEILFYFNYNGGLLFDYMMIVLLVITSLFTVVTYMSYAKRFLGIAFINMISAPIFYLLFLLSFGGMTEVQGDDYTVGFLLIVQVACTLFCLISGTILAVWIRIIRST
ncbi:MAG TPA: hypothetical protein IAA29_07100 [Candidatus Paenibacillus intestinavium]|nr:hypothetical protein [Candidatus Paenibacillus intestinavium]